MKHSSSAFSQPQPSIRRLVSIRRGSSIILKNPPSGDHAQKREPDSLLVVEEEDASIHQAFDSPQNAAGAGAAAATDGPTPTTDSSAEDGSVHDGRSRTQRSPSLPDNSVGAGEHCGEDSSDASKLRRVTFSPPSASSNSHDTRLHSAPFDRSPFDVRAEASSPAAPAVTVGGSASSAAISSQMAKILEAKSAIEQQYVGGKSQAYVPGSRRTLKSAVQLAVQDSVAPASQRSQHLQHAEVDKSGWLDKMKKNVVGFFEGGDSDISSSDEEHPQHNIELAEVDVQMLQTIIEAVKAADPPLVHEHKKASRFALGSSSHVLPLTFRGSALVDWLLDPAKAGKFAVQSRSRAVAICQAMGSNGLIRNFDKDAASSSFKDADLLYRFECDEKFLKDAEARAPVTVSKFQKFRGSVAGSAAASAIVAQGEKSTAADVLSAGSAVSAVSKTETENLSKPTIGLSSAGSAHFASEDVSRFSAPLSADHHGQVESFRPSLSHSSRITSLDSRDINQRVIDLGTASTSLSLLKASTDARIAAVEARTLHLQAQLDHMLSQIDIKDREIGEKLHDIEQMRSKLEEECSETHEGLVVVQTIWDEKMSIYEKIHSELPLIDAKIKDFEKLHEDAKDKIDEAQQRLKRIRDQQSISLEGSGTMTWNDWFMSWCLVISMFLIKWFFAILTRLRLYKAPIRSNMQDIDRAKAVVDSAESAGGSAAIAECSSNATALSNTVVGIDLSKQKARVSKRASVMLRAGGQPTADRSFIPPSQGAAAHSMG